MGWVWGKICEWRLAILVIALLAIGVIGLSTAVGWPLAITGAVVALLTAFVKFNKLAGRVVGATVLGTLVLVGVNVLVDNAVDKVGVGRPGIRLGLAFAIVVFAASAGWYLRGDEPPPPPGTEKPPESLLGRGSQWTLWTTAVAATALAVFLLIDVPIIVERGKHSVWSIVVGLAVVVVLCGLGLWCRAKQQNVGMPRKVGGFLAPTVGVILLGLAPIVVQQQKDHRRDVPQRQQVGSKVDIRIVTDGSRHPEPAHVALDPAFAGFDVRYSVGFADGQDVHWTLVESKDADEALRVASRGSALPDIPEPPLTRKNADSVLLLLVDGTAPVVDGPVEQLPNVRASKKEVGRWRRISHVAREPRMPTFALLQTTGPKRLDSWRRFTGVGGAVSLQVLGRTAVTNAGVALGVGATTAEADLALAIEHRPILLFDESEPVPRPLSVEWLFRQRLMHLCRDEGVAKTECDKDPITDPRMLENNGTHLEIDRPDAGLLRRTAKQERGETGGVAVSAAIAAADVAGAPPPSVALVAPSLETIRAPAADGAAAKLPALKAPAADAHAPETTIYVHPVPIQRDGKNLLYLDYWWYLPDNPVTVGMKAFCGAGLVIPGITCHDHQSDWEGLTVVVDRTAVKPRVRSVQYAEHNEVVSFGWPLLRGRWDHDDNLKKIVAAADNGPQRPLAFIASGTHSTYPIPCTIADCRQFTSGTGEDDYRGGLPWIGNVTNVCGRASCVQSLPTWEGGRQPALWNAFSGTWGKQSCALTYYCNSAESPKAPGQQKRYQHPTRCTGVADKDWHFKRQSCDE